MEMEVANICLRADIQKCGFKHVQQLLTWSDLSGCHFDRLVIIPVFDHFVLFQDADFFKEWISMLHNCWTKCVNGDCVENKCARFCKNWLLLLWTSTPWIMLHSVVSLSSPEFLDQRRIGNVTCEQRDTWESDLKQVLFFPPALTQGYSTVKILLSGHSDLRTETHMKTN